LWLKGKIWREKKGTPVSVDLHATTPKELMDKYYNLSTNNYWLIARDLKKTKQ